LFHFLGVLIMKKSRFHPVLFASTCVMASGLAVPGFAAAPTMPVIADGIAGVVASARGPEAGVWVIAETRDLPTRMIKMVVTDDQGRFVLPELPKGKYEVWVRGYGLVDSPRVVGAPGKNMNLTAVTAPNAAAAAEYYPANYWFALIKPPPESDFPGTGPKGNGIAPTMLTQQMWTSHMKNGCVQCHQQGDAPTRILLDNTSEGWAQRITKARADGDHALGDRGKHYAQTMQNSMAVFGRSRALTMWTDWTQRIEKGALPEAPPRPAGIERNIVLTSWDWAGGRYAHDLIATDRHNPNLNANGPVYGVIGPFGYIEVLDPVTGKQEEIGYKVTLTKNAELLPPDTVPNEFPHNPMLDHKGRLWITDLGPYRITPDTPVIPKAPYCTDEAGKYAKYWPQPGRATNTAVIYDPATRKVEGIPMCNGTHHLMMASDRNAMYFSGGDGRVASWVDVKAWDDTHDPQKSVGWCPLVLDTNAATPSAVGANSAVSITPDRTQWNQPARPGGPDMSEGGASVQAAASMDPKRDTRIEGFLYGVDTDVKDGGMWYAKTSPFPTGIVRFHPGTNPPQTCKTEFFEPPKLPDGKLYAAYNGRGVSVDSKAVAWVAYGSGQLGRFDRAKCRVLSGPTSTGQHCPEGWSFFDSPGPKMDGVEIGSADFHYLNWVDIHDTLGLGKDTPILAGSNSDALLAFDEKTETFTVLRVPYPRSFHTRGMDGRVDDPSKGWKGKGIFATYASQPVWHQEGGEDGSGPQIVKFQIRPNPLAF